MEKMKLKEKRGPSAGIRLPPRAPRLGGSPSCLSLSGLFWEILGLGAERERPWRTCRLRRSARPRLPTNFGQSGGGGALRAGHESARRNAQDSLFPARRTNVLGPGRGGP